MAVGAGPCGPRARTSQPSTLGVDRGMATGTWHARSFLVLFFSRLRPPEGFGSFPQALPGHL